MTQGLDVRTLEPDELSSITARARTLVPTLKALADENRLAIALLLADGSRTVREITDATGLSQTLVSHHLATLREQELVTLTPRGRANVYSLCCDQLAAPVQLLASLAALSPRATEECCATPLAD